MNDDSTDSHVTASKIIHGLIIGFAAWMVVLVVILIALTLSGKAENNSSKKNENPQSYTSENHQ